MEFTKKNMVTILFLNRKPLETKISFLFMTCLSFDLFHQRQNEHKNRYCSVTILQQKHFFPITFKKKFKGEN